MTRRMRLIGPLTVAVSIACASAQQTTPGPGARAGAAIDRAYAGARDDVAEALLWTKVRIALLEHLKGDALRVKVEVRGREVVLSGQVERRASQELASEVAGSIAGVKRVTNRLRINPEPVGAPVARAVGKAEREVADGLLEGKVKLRLLDELGRVGFAVEVEAVDGVVSLSGSVPDQARRQLAVETTRKTPGVVEVMDLLKTGP